MIGDTTHSLCGSVALDACVVSTGLTATRPASADELTALAGQPARRRRAHAAPGQPAVDFRDVRSLIFDAGDVLYDATLWRRWLLQLLARMGLHASYRGFYRVWEHDFLAPVHRGECEFNHALRTFLRAAGLSSGQIDEIEAASQARRRELETGTRLLPGVRSTLRRLHGAGVALGVLCNAELPGHELALRLAGLGLEGLFTAVVSSMDLQRTKPDAECYVAALSAMGHTAEATAFIGHDERELAGAAVVGLRTVAFNAEPGVVADRTIGPFDQLWDLVRGGADGDGASLA